MVRMKHSVAHAKTVTDTRQTTPQSVPGFACAAKGFTLMELILVLAVVAIVLTISSPSLRGFFASRQTADSAATVLSLTQWARSHAISQGCPCRLNIDTASGTYWLTIQKTGQYVELDDDLGQHFQLPEGAKIDVKTDSAQAVNLNANVLSGSRAGINTGGDGVAAGLAKLGIAKSQTVSYISFYPSGRCDTATISITGPQGESYTVTNPSATEAFRVTSPAEAK